MSLLDYWLSICQAPSLYARAGRLVDRIGGPEALWLATKGELMSVGCSEETAERICLERRGVSADRVRERLSRTHARAVCFEDDGYPKTLRMISDPPRILFCRGKEIEKLRNAVAIVGSRSASAYGRSMAESIAEELSGAGIAVASGLARGIDTAAHRGALKGNGRTVAILGCGLDITYPPENSRLMEEIAVAGWIITEYPPGTLPLPMNFPARNRIIAGISVGVVVVEAAERSGALITADFALEQGKEVFALPGNVRSPQSRGAHALLKQGAVLIEDAADVLETFGIRASESISERDVSDAESRVLNAMGWEPVHVDQIARLVGDTSEASTLLTILEIKGAIRKDHGGLYLRIK
ncbi:MAG: DNA-processing protein DprA [Actinobacteria bacterium]|nr:DNA-processing protein DprA [Actinomycetota bacterium]